MNTLKITAEDKAKIETFNKAFPVGTDVAVVLDDGSRKIMVILAGALPTKEGITVVIGTDAVSEAGQESVLIARIRARAIEKKASKEQLRVALTDVERLEFGNEIADNLSVVAQLEKEMKGSADLFKGKIAAAEAAVKSKADLLRAGYDIRAVDCETVIDFDRQRAIKRRKDLGAVIDDRQLRPDEQNRELVLFPEAHKAEEAATDQPPLIPPMPATPEEKPDDAEIEQAAAIILETKRASVSSLQRRLKIGYTRAARIMDVLEERGVVGPAKMDGGNRDILKAE